MAGYRDDRFYSKILALIALFAAAGASAVAAASPAAPEPQTTSFTLTVDWLEGPINLLLTGEEEAIARGLDASQRDLFLKWFWARRDPRPDTERNEFRDIFDSRLSYVQKEFTNRVTGQPGWATSRGIFFLLLGPPDATYRPRGLIATRAGFRPAVLWDYRRLRLLFVEMNHDMVLAIDGPSDATLIRHEILSAVNRAVHDARLPLELPSNVHVLDATLPVAAAFADDADSPAVELTFALQELRGELVDGAMVVDLRLALESGPAARVVAVGDESASGPAAGPVVASPPSTDIDMRLRLDPAELAAAPGEPVRVLVLLPPRDPDTLGSGILRVEERSTGRVARVPLSAAVEGGKRSALPGRYPVARLLSVNLSGVGGLMAVAFIGADGGPTDGNSLWLQRRPPGGADTTLARAGASRFWLLPAARSCIGC